MKYRILFFFLFIPFLNYGQKINEKAISGTVIDVRTGIPLVNATVILYDTDKGTTTNQNGEFLIPKLSSGIYTLKVSYIGYKTIQKKIEIKNASVMHIKIFLEDTSFVSKEIEITAKRVNDILNQSNRINIITAKNILTIPAQNINNIIDYSTGIYSNNTSGIFSSKSIITMRGLPSNDQARTLVILDGVILNKSDQGSVNWNLINKNSIEQIKIIKGPGPAKYGSGAMGGVIELSSKIPTKTVEGNILVEYGTYNTLSSNVSIAGIKYRNKPSQYFYWIMDGFGRRSDGYITLPEQYMTVDDTIVVPTFLKELNTSLKFGYRFNKNQQLEIKFNYFDDIRGNGVKVFDYYGAFQQHLTYQGVMRYEGVFKNVKVNATAFNLTENYFRIYEYLKEKTYQLYQADSKREDRGGNIDLLFLKYKKQQISGGINFKYGSVAGQDTYYTSTDVIRNAGKMNTYALYLQDELTLNHEKISLNAGLRLDMATFYDGLFTIDNPSYSIIFYKNFENGIMSDEHWTALCPRISLKYKFSNEKRIYISLAKGFRAPNLDDMCRTGKKQGGFKVSNPRLKPELLNTVEIGGDVKIGQNGIVGSSLFYSIGHNFMYHSSTGDSVNVGYANVPIFQKQNIGKVELYGLEMEIKYNILDSLIAFASYTYTHAKIKEDYILNALVDSNLSGKYLTDIPNHIARAGITWKNKILSTTLLYKYIGKTWINEWNVIDEEYFKTDQFPDYGIFNVRIDKEIHKNFYASISIENIFNKTYINNNLEQCAGRFISCSFRYQL